jgi:hypothetical protein
MLPRICSLVGRATFAAALALGAIALPARAQNPVEPPPGSNADTREDSRGVEALKSRVDQDKARLWADQQQFGKNSPQARNDRARLKEDRRMLKRLRRDTKHDRKLRQRRQANRHSV